MFTKTKSFGDVEDRVRMHKHLDLGFTEAAIKAAMTLSRGGSLRGLRMLQEHPMGRLRPTTLG